MHGEGACWFKAYGTLLWVDMLAGDVLRLDPGGSVERWHVDTVAAVVRPRADGGLVVAGERSIFVTSAYGEELTPTRRLLDDPDLRFNEGAVDAFGRFWAGTTSWSGASGTGALYCFDNDLVATPVLKGISVSNGLAWTSDGAHAYYVDSATGRVDVLDTNGGKILNRRAFVAIEEGTGMPDGLCLDAEGGVWVALWDGGEVRRYDEKGRLTERVELPVRLVTSCSFGGPDFSDLFVTTSRLGEPPHQAGAGSVFRVPTGTTGLPTPPVAS